MSFGHVSKIDCTFAHVCSAFDSSDYRITPIFPANIGRARDMNIGQARELMALPDRFPGFHHRMTCEYCFANRSSSCGEFDPWIGFVCEPCYAKTENDYRTLGIQKVKLLGAMWAAKASRIGTDAFPAAFSMDAPSLLIHAFLWESGVHRGLWISDWAKGTAEMNKTHEEVESFTVKSKRRMKRLSNRALQPVFSLEEIHRFGHRMFS